jgi:phosphopantothenoylcysteine decarboxylase/phosphopantothenate--cysteine ligase
MAEAAVEAAATADLFIAAAAVGDYTTEAAAAKIKSGSPLTVEFEPTDKVVDAVRTAAPELAMVCFKAEVADEETLLAEAQALRERTDALFVVANQASVMGAETTTVRLVGTGSDAPITGDKPTVAAAIVEAVVSARSEDDE